MNRITIGANDRTDLNDNDSQITSHDIAISVKNLGKKYHLYNSPKHRLKEALHPFRKKYHLDFWALKDVTFEIRQGEVVGIIGRNGSGKSTLLQIISGILQPSEGELIVNGRVSALIELGAGFNPELTGRENVRMYSSLMGISKTDFDQIFPTIEAFADIGEFINQPMKTFSSGMYVRLAFSAAIHVDPDILIVDEALAVGDELFQRKCFSRMERLIESGKTILFVTHSMALVNQFCSRAILLDSGELLLQGRAKNVITQYERYLFSDPRHSATIREELKKIDLRNTEEALGSVLTQNANENSIFSTDDQLDFDSEFMLKAKLCDDLISKNAVEYKNYAVHISNIKIKTIRGAEVNVLVPNEQYVYSYDVSFGVDAEDVSFGMVFRTHTGLIITASASFELLPDTVNAKNGEQYQVDWPFTCCLLPGFYFTDVGVSAIINDQRTYLNRIVDALAFKVADKSMRGHYGLITANQTPHIQKIKGRPA